MQGITRYRCRDCGMRFVWTSDLPKRHFFSHIMSFAIELYTSLRRAASLRGIADLLKQVFNINVTYEAIRQWILAASKNFYRREINTSFIWHADETYIKIQGRGYWLWIVYGHDTKQIIAWHLSKTRLLPDAISVMRLAYANNKFIRPEKITTDGLWQYPVAIYKTLGWNWKEHKQHHIIDSGIGKNAFVERLNKEVKRRVKWFSTFQSVEGALAFFGLWFYHYNQRNATHVT